MDRWTDDRRGDQNAGEQNVGFPQDAGGALFVFRNRSFPKAFRGIHDSVEQPTGGPGVRRARPACPGTGQCSAGAGARASAGPHPARPPWGGTAAARWGWGPGLGQGREAPGVGETVRTASLEARGPGEQVECGQTDAWCGRLHLPVCVDVHACLCRLPREGAAP